MKKWKCTVCSYIYTGEEKPERCPACGAGTEMLIEVSEEGEKPAEGGMQDSEASKQEQRPESPEKQKKWKCTVCNYIHEGDEPPEKCPVCGADKSFFVEVTDKDEAEEQKETASLQGQEAEQKTDAKTAVTEEKDFGILGKLIVGHHLHPISVHTPNGVLPIGIMFLLGAMIFGFTSLELASLFNLIVVLLSIPPVVITGYVAWQLKYKGISTPVFKIKLFCALVVAVLLTLMICWRLIDSSVPLAGTAESWIYFGLGAVALAAVGIAGHLGGKLVFERN